MFFDKKLQAAYPKFCFKQKVTEEMVLGSRVGVMAFHGGSLERMTDVIADAVVAATGASTKELMARMGQSSPRAALIYQHATQDREAAIAAGLSSMIEEHRSVTS